MAKKRDRSGDSRPRLPIVCAPSRGMRMWVFTRPVYYAFYIGVVVAALVMHDAFSWSIGVLSVMALAWLTLVVFMIRADARRIVAAELTEGGLRLRYLWGRRYLEWGQIRGYLYRRPEDLRNVVVRVVPRRVDGHIPRFSTLVLTEGDTIRIDGKSLDRPEQMLTAIAQLARGAATAAAGSEAGDEQ